MQTPARRAALRWLCLCSSESRDHRRIIQELAATREQRPAELIGWSEALVESARALAEQPVEIPPLLLLDDGLLLLTRLGQRPTAVHIGLGAGRSLRPA